MFPIIFLIYLCSRIVDDEFVIIYYACGHFGSAIFHKAATDGKYMC